jgi:hypothetical protein
VLPNEHKNGGSSPRFQSVATNKYCHPRNAGSDAVDARIPPAGANRRTNRSDRDRTVDQWASIYQVNTMKNDVPPLERQHRKVSPAFYKLAEVETILNFNYQTIYALCRAGILVKTGRGKGSLVSVESVDALIDWMQKGYDKWQAPRMRSDRPGAPVAPVVRVVSGKTRKRAAGGTPSASMETAQISSP